MSGRIQRSMALCTALAMGATSVPAAAREAPAPRLLVTYFEAPPGKAARLTRVLETYAAALPRKQGQVHVQVLAEEGRPGRLAVIERWPAESVPDPAALTALEGKAAPLLQAPADRRDHDALVAWSGKRLTGPFHMLMHVDVAPAGADMAARLLSAQKDTVLAARGALGFEAATQQGKPNHFAVHEVWQSRAAYEAYVASPAGRALRAQLATAKGALYDDRLYRPLPPPWSRHR